MQDKGSLPSSKLSSTPTKVSIKDSSVPVVKRLASALDSAPSQSGHKELVLNKRWTDGSVSWDSLPPALASLGKVKEGRAPLPEEAFLLAVGVMRTSRQQEWCWNFSFWSSSTIFKLFLREVATCSYNKIIGWLKTNAAIQKAPTQCCSWFYFDVESWWGQGTRMLSTKLSLQLTSGTHI